MKKILFALLGLIGLCSCENNAYTISGNIGAGVIDSILLIPVNGEGVLLSTAVDKDGSFKMNGTLEAPSVAFLSDGTRPFAVIFLEKGNINISHNEKYGFEVAGTTLNDEFNALSHNITELEQDPELQDTEALKAKFAKMISDAVTANINNILGTYIFARYEINNLKPTEARTRLAQFTEELQKSDILIEASAMLSAEERTSEGSLYTNLTLINTLGEPLSLSSFVGEGKWVLLDFWATWCGPCRGEIPDLKEAYKTYKDRGLTIYGVSLDNDAEAWKKYVADNDMSWPNVLGIENGRSEASDVYAIRSIPANFLIGPDGRIMAKNLRGDQIIQKLSELIK